MSETENKTENNHFEELTTAELDGVAGGTLPLTDAQGYLCPCDLCNEDTLWNPVSGGYACEKCGTVKSAEWYRENKIRRRGIRIL